MSVIVSNLPLTVPLWQRAYSATTTIIHNHSSSKSANGTYCKSESFANQNSTYDSCDRRSLPLGALVKIFRLSRSSNKSSPPSRFHPKSHSQSHSPTFHSRFGSIPASPVLEKKSSNPASPITNIDPKLEAVRFNTFDVIDGVETTDVVDLESGRGAENLWLSSTKDDDFMSKK